MKKCFSLLFIFFFSITNCFEDCLPINSINYNNTQEELLKIYSECGNTGWTNWGDTT